MLQKFLLPYFGVKELTSNKKVEFLNDAAVVRFHLEQVSENFDELSLVGH
ncbi:MAG: hypothetical protein OJF47_002163 [Nitrospira sp.]|nr:MAG: hypothetical protein OJF47_002163 [Nitrospira sp.]